MIVLVKLTLFCLWLVAFAFTCLIMGTVFPLIVIYEKLTTVMNGTSVG